MRAGRALQLGRAAEALRRRGREHRGAACRESGPSRSEPGAGARARQAGDAPTPTPLPSRRRRGRLAALTAAFLVANLALGALAGTGAGPARPAVHMRMLALSPALAATIRTSYYDAYRADPDPLSAFGARAGLPESAVFGPQLVHAGELLAATPAEASTWVVASVCIGSHVGCQDAGAFQVFDRTGASGAYFLDGFEPCLVPEPLAQTWFPAGRAPLGTRCPAAAELVPRMSLRSGAWTALLPQSWRRVGCQTASQALARQLLCSFLGGDTDIDVWYDPADTGERFVVVTCRGGGCSPLAPAGGPEITLPAGARALARSRESLSFVAPPGVDQVERLTEGTGAIRGLILAARLDGSPSYPLMTVTISLPESQSALAAAILRSFVSPQTSA